MSDRIKAKIGEELYSQIIAAGIKATEFDFVDGYIPKARFNEINEKLKNATEKNTTYESKLKDTEKLFSENEDLKGKYSSLSDKYNQDLSNKDKELLNITKRFKVESHLMNEGAKHTDLLLSKIDLDKLTIEGDNLLGFTDIVKDLKTNYGDLFTTKQITTKTNSKSKSNTPPIEDTIGEDGIDWGKKLDYLIK